MNYQNLFLSLQGQKRRIYVNKHIKLFIICILTSIIYFVIFNFFRNEPFPYFPFRHLVIDTFICR